jgi:hypothetical protein
LEPDCDSNDATFCDYKIAKLGEDVTMYCNNTSEQAKSIPDDGYKPIFWTLRIPDVKMINSSEGRYIVGEDIWNLTIVNTTLDDIGQYHCVLQNDSGEYYLVRTGLNSRGPYFEDGWEMYKLNTLIGFCSLIGFLFLTGLLIVLYRFRYIPEPGEVGVLYSLPNEGSNIKAINEEKTKGDAKTKDDKSSSGNSSEEKESDDVMPEVKLNEYEDLAVAKPAASGIVNPAFNPDEVTSSDKAPKEEEKKEVSPTFEADDVTVTKTPNGALAPTATGKNATKTSPAEDAGTGETEEADYDENSTTSM